MPTIGTHRGVPLHAFQSSARIEVVKAAIDSVYLIADAPALAAYAAEPAHPPEARLFAAARCEATWQLAAESRAVRPVVNLVHLHAAVAGLSSLKWMSPTHYGSEFESMHRQVRRERPLSPEELRQ